MNLQESAKTKNVDSKWKLRSWNKKISMIQSQDQEVTCVGKSKILQNCGMTIL